MKINSLYICVNDMNRAICFYEDFFDKKVAIKDTIYSVFTIGTFRFGLFAYQEMNEKHTFGSNCLPSIELTKEDEKRIDVVLRKYQRPIVFPLTKINDLMVFEFQDTEGNNIEVTYPCI